MFSPNKESKKMQAELSNSSNIIGKGTTISGNIESFGNVRVEGKVEGDIKTKSKASFGDSAVVIGNVLAQNADVSGEIKGVIEVQEVLTLRPSAVIHGDVITGKLIIEEGAIFNGSCKMGAVIKEITLGESRKEQSKTA